MSPWMGTYILQRRPYLEEGSGCLKAHMGNGYPLAAGQMGVARADAGEGREGQDPWSQRWVGSVRPVHLIWVAEGPTPSQWIHNLQERVGELLPRQALGEPRAARHLQGGSPWASCTVLETQCPGRMAPPGWAAPVLSGTRP